MTTVCLTFDFDALSIWISTFRQTTPTPLSRGEYGARVGIERILKMLDGCGVPATFFVPAHTARSFPAAIRSIIAAGHEIAAHGLVHESPVGLEHDEERDLLRRSLDIIEEVSGTRPRGYRSPAWDLSDNTIALLEENGLIYDSSMMADDFRPFRARRGDVVTEEGFTPGVESGVIEFPVAWELDDYPYFHFATRPINQGLRHPEEVGSLWKAEFDWCHHNIADGVFTLTTHPEIIGRGPRISMFGNLVGYMQRTPGVTFSTLGGKAAAIAASSG
jgi:peptidoglycan/xylan/chitin deacetylase (PgdA/CDA1 family)